MSVEEILDATSLIDNFPTSPIPMVVLNIEAIWMTIEIETQKCSNKIHNFTANNTTDWLTTPKRQWESKKVYGYYSPLYIICSYNAMEVQVLISDLKFGILSEGSAPQN